MSAWKLKDIDGAEKSFEISNLLDNTNAETWGLLTIICLIIGVGQNRAFQSYQRSIRLGLNNFEIFAELAFLFTKSKDLHSYAEFCYERALKIDPKQEDIWIQYGDFTREFGKLKKSVECYQKALQYINGEVKYKEVEEKLDSTNDQYTHESKALLTELKKESNACNQIAVKH